MYYGSVLLPLYDAEYDDSLILLHQENVAYLLPFAYLNDTPNCWFTLGQEGEVPHMISSGFFATKAQSDHVVEMAHF